MSWVTGGCLVASFAVCWASCRTCIVKYGMPEEVAVLCMIGFPVFAGPMLITTVSIFVLDLFVNLSETLFGEGFPRRFFWLR